MSKNKQIGIVCGCILCVSTDKNNNHRFIDSISGAKILTM